MKNKRDRGGAPGDTFDGHARGAPPRPNGAPAAGKVGRLLIGQGHGYIRMSDGRDVYFHRGDLAEDASFNSFAVGDEVAFELLDDRFSGPRAINVRHRRARPE